MTTLLILQGKLGFYAKNVFLPLHMQGTNFPEDSLCPSDDELRQFPWFFRSDEAICDPSNVTYPTISAMSQAMMEEANQLAVGLLRLCIFQMKP